MADEGSDPDNVIRGNFRFVVGRPDLGLSTQSQNFVPLRPHHRDNLNLNGEEQEEEPGTTRLPVNILSPADGLPAYSVFPTLPKLGRRKRPKCGRRLERREEQLGLQDPTASAEEAVNIIHPTTTLGREEFGSVDEVMDEGMDIEADPDDGDDNGLDSVNNIVMIPEVIGVDFCLQFI
eukprot:gene13382-14754_t